MLIGKVALSEVLHAIGFDDLSGFVDVVGAEYQDAFAIEKERVEVDDTDASVADGSYGFGGTARLVVEFQGKHFRQCYSHACFFEGIEGPLRFRANHAIDAVFGSVGDG